MRKMRRSTIEKRVKQALLDVLDVDKSAVTMDANIKMDLNADSLDAVEIVMELEQTFGITIKDEEMPTFDEKTVREVCDYVEKAMKDGKG